MSLRILYKYTTRSRPEKFMDSVSSILQNETSKLGKYSFRCSFDLDDTSCHQFWDVTYLDPVYGISKNKIHAINRDMELAAEFDILVVMSDDMKFIKKGFDDIIREQFKDSLDLFVHFPDQNQGANCCTMSIMGRDYYERDKFIYDPRFESLWSDIVAQEMAQIRGCYKYVPERIFDHLHPSFGQCAYDEQYRKTEDFAVRQRDYNTYLECKKEYDPTNQFPIRSI